MSPGAFYNSEGLARRANQVGDRNAPPHSTHAWRSTMVSPLTQQQVPDTARTELTPEQVGHLRHFANLLAQPSNDWSFMQGKGLGQDDFGGYRCQLAYMTYAMALAHMHRLPAAPGLFKPLFEKAIAKILHPEVWI
jgi:hypothetical protein